MSSSRVSLAIGSPSRSIVAKQPLVDEPTRKGAPYFGSFDSGAECRLRPRSRAPRYAAALRSRASRTPSFARSLGDRDRSVVAPRRRSSSLGRNTSLDRIAKSAPPIACRPGRTTITLLLAMAPADSSPTRPNFRSVPRPVTSTSSAATE